MIKSSRFFKTYTKTRWIRVFNFWKHITKGVVIYMCAQILTGQALMCMGYVQITETPIPIPHDIENALTRVKDSCVNGKDVRNEIVLCV